MVQFTTFSLKSVQLTPTLLTQLEKSVRARMSKPGSSPEVKMNKETAREMSRKTSNKSIKNSARARVCVRARFSESMVKLFSY